VIPASGTNVKWRPMKPSLRVPNAGSSVSTSTLDVFEFADPLAVAVDQLLAVPLGNVSMRDHLCLLPGTAAAGACPCQGGSPSTLLSAVSQITPLAPNSAELSCSFRRTVAAGRARDRLRRVQRIRRRRASAGSAQ